MATHLAAIYGTEHDKVNCAFYHKIGACRHGDKCSRKHVKPTYSQTILCRNLYQDPALRERFKSDTEEAAYFDNFYVDFFVECCRYGHVEEVVVCENNNDHLTGNVYCRFRYEEEAARACDAFNGRWYAGRPVYCELSPVTEFSEACCRQHEMKECKRGRFCNFMHAKVPPRKVLRELRAAQRKKSVMEREKQTRSKRAKKESRDYTDSESEERF